MSKYALIFLLVLVVVSVLAEARRGHMNRRVRPQRRPGRRGQGDRAPGLAWEFRNFMRNCMRDNLDNEEVDEFDDLTEEGEENVEVGGLTPLNSALEIDPQPRPVDDTEIVNPRRRMRLERRQQRQNRRIARRRGRPDRLNRRMNRRQHRQQRRQQRRQLRRTRWCEKVERNGCAIPERLAPFCQEEEEEEVEVTASPVVL